MQLKCLQFDALAAAQTLLKLFAAQLLRSGTGTDCEEVAELASLDDELECATVMHLAETGTLRFELQIISFTC